MGVLLFNTFKPGCRVNTGFLVIFLTIVSQNSGSITKEGKMQMSSLLADTVNNLIEKLKVDEHGDNVEGASSFPQTRGGGGGYGHGGGGGNGHGAITLDPVSIISLLALGAFLINNILQLLRANMAAAGGGGATPPAMPGKSMRSSPLEMYPLLASALASNGLNDVNQPSFMDFFENIGSLYYLQPKKRNMCMKRIVCNYLNIRQSREKTPNDLRATVFDFMLSTVTRLVAPDISDADKEEKCTRAHKFCSDALLKDARVSIEYKVYSQVSSWITKLAFNGFSSG